MKKLLIVGAVTAALAACASPPQRSEQVEQARTEIQTLSQDPMAQQAAGGDLDAARKSLQQAETALQQKQPPAVVDHYAYLAKRHAEAGEARAAEAHSRQEVARGQDERNQIIMQARNREASNAQASAEAARNQAAAAQAQLASAQQQLADLQAKQTDRGVVVTLGDVLFDTGKSTLKPGATVAPMPATPPQVWRLSPTNVPCAALLAEIPYASPQVRKRGASVVSDAPPPPGLLRYALPRP